MFASVLSPSTDTCAYLKHEARVGAFVVSGWPTPGCATDLFGELKLIKKIGLMESQGINQNQITRSRLVAHQFLWAYIQIRGYFLK